MRIPCMGATIFRQMGLNYSMVERLLVFLTMILQVIAVQRPLLKSIYMTVLIHLMVIGVLQEQWNLARTLKILFITSREQSELLELITSSGEIRTFFMRASKAKVGTMLFLGAMRRPFFQVIEIR